MSLEAPELLLERLRLGELRPADLTGEQFQAILFHKLVEAYRKQCRFDYELLDDYHGAVDFVVREKAQQTSPFHAGDPVHMFECKYYKRTLELSTIAKLLVVGVRFQPSSLNVVSR